MKNTEIQTSRIQSAGSALKSAGMTNRNCSYVNNILLATAKATKTATLKFLQMVNFVRSTFIYCIFTF